MSLASRAAFIRLPRRAAPLPGAQEEPSQLLSKTEKIKSPCRSRKNRLGETGSFKTDTALRKKTDLEKTGDYGCLFLHRLCPTALLMTTKVGGAAQWDLIARKTSSKKPSLLKLRRKCTGNGASRMPFNASRRAEVLPSR